MTYKSGRLSVLVLFIFLAACSKNTLEEPMTETTVIEGSTIWDGATITFSKAEGADPTAAENQDRLTDNVWLTRGNNGGQIFNIRSEMSASKSSSPAGTLWAEGRLDEIERLSFQRFRAAVGDPKNVEGKDLVLFLEQDSVYLSVKFTQWSQNKNGGFAYERSTEN